MTLITTDFLLEATGVSKTYGAVVALRSAWLAVRPGEVHALMGANGAGKSTLVKILTGAVHPDAGSESIMNYPWSYTSGESSFWSNFRWEFDDVLCSSTQTTGSSSR